jgi:hypothetical protein
LTLPRADKDLGITAETPWQKSENLERAAREFAQDLVRQNLTQDKLLRSQDPVANKIEDATIAMQGVAKEFQALTGEQNAQVAQAADAIDRRDPQQLEEAISQMSRELERLAATRAESMTEVDRMASNWQSAALGAALQATDAVRDALQSEPRDATYNTSVAGEQRPQERSTDLPELRERADPVSALYDPHTDVHDNEPRAEAREPVDAAREIQELADRLAAQTTFDLPDQTTLTDNQIMIVRQATSAVREQDAGRLAESVRALEQERAIVEKRIDEAARPLSPSARMPEALAWKAAQASVDDSRRQVDTLTSARDLAESARNALADPQRRTAEKLSFRNDFSKVPAIKAVWEKAAAGRDPNLDGFKAARASFWRQVNSGKSPDAQAIATMIRDAGWVLATEDRAPRPQVERFAKSAQADPAVARAIDKFALEIDHIDPKSRSPELMLDPSNLRFMPGPDNRQRGNWFTAEDKDTRATKLVEDIIESSRDAMSVEEAGRQRFDNELNSQRVRDEEDLKKRIEFERLKLGLQEK